VTQTFPGKTAPRSNGPGGSRPKEFAQLIGKEMALADGHCVCRWLHLRAQKIISGLGGDRHSSTVPDMSVESKLSFFVTFVAGEALIE
jgi:hypothetical protein